MVAGRPRSSPAAPRISDPVHTEVVQVDRWWMRRIQSSTAVFAMVVVVPRSPPPGTSSTSARSTLSSERSATRASSPVSVRTRPAFSATVVTVTPGTRHSTSYGPTASSAVNPSYSSTATRRPAPRRCAAAGDAKPMAHKPAPTPPAATAFSTIRRLLLMSVICVLLQDGGCPSVVARTSAKVPGNRGEYRDD